MLTTAVMEVTVHHGKSKYTKTFPLSTTLGVVKLWLEEQTAVPITNQTLLLKAPVTQQYRRPKETESEVSLSSILPASLIEKLQDCGARQKTSEPQCVKVSAMLIGTPETHLLRQQLQLTTEASAIISRVVATTLEQDSRWFRCSYGQGYLRQTAYVCRTCVDEGRAAPDHAVCLACTEVCHANHNVEEWGVRYHMRCDCCTTKCWRKPTASSASDGVGRAPRDEQTKVPEPPKNADSAAPTVVTPEHIESRSKRKRSRSRSPIKSPIGPDGSPLMGIRVPAVVNTPSPFGIHDPPENETEAVSSPIAARSVTTPNPNNGGSSRHPYGSQPSPPLPAAPGNFSLGVVTSATNSSNPPKAAGDGAAPGTTTATETTTTETAGETSSSTLAGSPSSPGAVLLPPFEGCRFILDNTTNRPPAVLIPPNRRNRYPRSPLTWCYCKVEEPAEEEESGGLVCMLCTSCFWNTHITSLHAEQFKRVPCYGDVVQGETVIFRCHTCDTYVCAPCRHRCHKDHEIDEETIMSSELAERLAEEEEQRKAREAAEDEEDRRTRGISRRGLPGTQRPDRDSIRAEATSSGALFSCGCRGLCSIAETISPHEMDDPSTFLPFSRTTCEELMNNDIFTGFICADCMQENPWLLTEDLKKCRDGELPPKADPNTFQPVLPCRKMPGEDGTEGCYPYHGMILPVNAFAEESICSCAKCQESFDKFCPVAREDASHMMMNLCDQCDVCHRSIRDKAAFLCKNCEMSMTDAFMLCTECNAHREKMVEASQRVIVAQERVRDRNNDPAGGSGGNDGSTALPPSPPPPPPSLVEPTYVNSEGTVVRYEHDLTHQFLEDTQENLYALCGMQIVNSMEPQDRDFIAEHWEEMQELTPELTVQANFGPTVIQFSQEDLREFARVNAPGKETTPPPSS